MHYPHSLSFRLAIPVDLVALAQLDQVCFPESSASEQQNLLMTFMSYIENPTIDVICLTDRQNNLIGSSRLNYIDPSTWTANLDRLSIHPRYRGQGLSRELLAQSEKQARSSGALTLQLQCSETNVRGLSLYQSFGYRCIGQEGYYDDDSAALIFQRNLRSIFPSSQHRPMLKKLTRPLHAQGYPAQFKM